METRVQRDIRIVKEEYPSMSLEGLIVEILDRDISDRRGIKWEWEKIDPDVMQDLKLHWMEIIKEVIKSAQQETLS